MNMLSWAGVALSVFLTLPCFSSSGSPCAAAAVSFSLLSLIFVSYLPKRKLTKHPKLVTDKEYVECHGQGQQRGLESIGKEEKAMSAAAAAAAALEPNRQAPAVNEDAGPNQAKSELTPDQTSEISIYSSDSEDWDSLPSNSSEKNEEDADGLIEISLPYDEGDHISLHEPILVKEDDVLNDNEDDSLIELDISAGFIKTTGENEQNISI